MQKPLDHQPFPSNPERIFTDSDHPMPSSNHLTRIVAGGWIAVASAASGVIPMNLRSVSTLAALLIYGEGGVIPMNLRSVSTKPWQCLIGIGSCLVLSGCNDASQSDIAAEIRALVKIGMPQAMAVRRVGAAGFACSPADGGLSCSRHVSRNILVSCNQRINLRIDARSSIAAIDVLEPACFGGFG